MQSSPKDELLKCCFGQGPLLSTGAFRKYSGMFSWKKMQATLVSFWSEDGRPFSTTFLPRDWNFLFSSCFLLEKQMTTLFTILLFFTSQTFFYFCAKMLLVLFRQIICVQHWSCFSVFSPEATHNTAARFFELCSLQCPNILSGNLVSPRPKNKYIDQPKWAPLLFAPHQTPPFQAAFFCSQEGHALLNVVSLFALNWKLNQKESTAGTPVGESRNFRFVVGLGSSEKRIDVPGALAMCGTRLWPWLWFLHAECRVFLSMLTISSRYTCSGVYVTTRYTPPRSSTEQIHNALPTLLTSHTSIHQRIQVRGSGCSTPLPPTFFKIMQLSWNVKGKSPILSPFLGSVHPPPGQNSAGPTWPKSGIRLWVSDDVPWFFCFQSFFSCEQIHFPKKYLLGPHSNRWFRILPGPNLLLKVAQLENDPGAQGLTQEKFVVDQSIWTVQNSTPAVLAIHRLEPVLSTKFTFRVWSKTVLVDNSFFVSHKGWRITPACWISHQVDPEPPLKLLLTAASLISSCTSCRVGNLSNRKDYYPDRDDSKERSQSWIRSLEGFLFFGGHLQSVMQVQIFLEFKVTANLCWNQACFVNDLTITIFR